MYSMGTAVRLKCTMLLHTCPAAGSVSVPISGMYCTTPTSYVITPCVPANLWFPFSHDYIMYCC